MINVTKMNGDGMVLNAELIETMQANPDTLITLTTGNRLMVKEPVSEITEKVKDYRRQINIEAIETLSRKLEELG
ncbi:MAG: flagellar FlbD family protein [Elusimicrobia bacterium]|jgi:flagellar protein FlbD|nr:flagellar FlbD family protein [Elusimicrobiota bacterium]